MGNCQYIIREGSIHQSNDYLFYLLECMKFHRLLFQISTLEKEKEQRSKWKWTKSTCEEIRAFDPSKPSGVYTIDPDGFDRGEDPIAVDCIMENGISNVAMIHFSHIFDF